MANFEFKYKIHKFAIINFFKLKVMPNNESAIYLNFPNFQGRTTNALKIGSIDLGKVILGENAKLPVGHAATILFDNSGNAVMYEYGRYDQSDVRVFGEERGNTKRGNWRKRTLPKRNLEENYNDYISRIRSLIPQEYGSFEASYFPHIDYNKAITYINSSANNKNRSEYSLIHTCATEASKIIKNSANIPVNKQILNGIQRFTSLGRVINKTKEATSDNNASWSARLWGLLPGSTTDYNSEIKTLADETKSFK